MRLSAFAFSLALLLLSPLLQQTALPLASPGSSLFIERAEVRALGSLLDVDLRVCLEEEHAYVEAVGYPLAILEVEPREASAAVEDGLISVLILQAPACARVRYVSEAPLVDGVLRISHVGRVSELRVVLNLSIAIPVYVSPDPSEVYAADDLVVLVWLNAEGIVVDYVVLEYGPAPTPTPELTPAPTPALTPTPTPTPSPVVEELRPEPPWTIIVLAVTAAVLVAVALVLRSRR